MNEILEIDPKDFIEQKLIFLDEDQTSWIQIEHLPDEIKKYALENFDLLNNEHPESKGKILFYNKEIDSHRYYQSYLNTPKLDIEDVKNTSYMFSGFEPIKKEFPECFKVFLNYLNREKEKYNQSVVNWYSDGNDYLPFHKDWEKGKKECSDVVTMTIMNSEDIECRNFEIKPIRKKIDYLYDVVRIKTRHGVIITMGGHAQNKFLHGVPIMENYQHPRISITFRNFI